MFDILFGWRKASKCKNLIGRVQCRLKLLKNKRYSIIRQLRDDVAQLLNNGEEQSAFARVEQLLKDQIIMDSYDLLDHFCEFIIINLPYIRRNKDCPNDINEAVSSLIFAAPRCGDLPELQRLRKLFKDRYGDRFATAAVELLPGNLVNRQITEKLCMKLIPDEVKLKLMDEIARDHCVLMEPVGIEDEFEFHQQVDGNSDLHLEDLAYHRGIQVINNSVLGSQKQASNVKEVQGKEKSDSSSKNAQKFITESFQFNSTSDISITSASASIVMQPAENMVDQLMQKNICNMGNYDKLELSYEPEMVTYRYSGQSSRSSSILSNASLQHNMEVITATTSESSPQFVEKSAVYLDDIEEFQSPLVEDGNFKDQRLFMFKSSISPLKDNCRDGRASLLNLCYDDCDETLKEHYDFWDIKEGSRGSCKRRNSSAKGLKRRSLSAESQVSHSSMSSALKIKDAECELYYGENFDCSPVESHRSHHRRKHRKKMPIEEIRRASLSNHDKKLSSPQQPRYLQKSPKKLSYEEIGENWLPNRCKSNRRAAHGNFSCKHDMTSECCLEHPCYFFTGENEFGWESPYRKQRRGITTSVHFPFRNLEKEEWQNESCHLHCSPGKDILNGTFWAASNKSMINQEDKELGWDSLPQKPGRRNHDKSSIFYNDMDSQNHNANKQRKKTEGEAEEMSDCRPSYASSLASCSRVTSPWRYTEKCPPYSRAMTMPPVRPKNTQTDNICRRSTSCQLEQPILSSHVHPKLPDYDDIASKFMALKEEHLQRKHQLS